MHHNLFYITITVLGLLGIQGAQAQGSLLKRHEGAPFHSAPTEWVDAKFNSMSLDEKIGQLFMVAAYSNKGADHEKALEKLIKEQYIGGLIFFKGGPHRQAAMTNRLQAMSKTPLMLGMDAEWGLAMRLDSTVHFPYQMTLGAIRNDTIVYEMGKEIGRHLRRLDVHVNFAPVVDVNNNPDNPVINYRSFGEDALNVARKGTAYMKGLQEMGVMANAKHFPGHGDTDTDSHKALPIVMHDKDRLDSLELFPFRQLTNRGLSSMMVAHLYIPKLDSTPNLASTLSPAIVTDILRNELRFNGLVFTDALNMNGVAKYWKPGEVDLKALLAGNDVLLFPEDVPVAVEMIKQAIADGRLNQREVEEKCHKILMAKSWCGLGNRKPINQYGLYNDLNNSHAQRLNEILYERSLTMLKNDRAVLPISRAVTDSTAYLAIGAYLDNTFHEGLKQRGLEKALSVPRKPSLEKMRQVMSSLNSYKKVIIGVDGMNRNPKKNFGLTKEAILLIEQLSIRHDVVLTLFGNPYSLAKLSNIKTLEALIIAYEGNQITRRKAAAAVFGELDIDGRLPVSVGDYFKVGDGLVFRSGRLKHALPEEIGISSVYFDQIDSIAVDGVEKGAYPGCVVLVAKGGKIVYEQAYGHHTYEGRRPTTTDDIFDLASITKIGATGAAIMKLVEEGKVNIDGTLGEHLPEIPDTSEYHGLYLREILTHQAGLVPWIPFYASTLKNGSVDPELYRKKESSTYAVEVAKNLYMHRGQSDTIMTRILDTPLRSKKSYKYSDLGYYFMKAIVEEKADTTLDAYVKNNFYQPMGLNSMGYLPLNRFESDRIVPTEFDMYYRMQLLQGHVHDMGAAMQGGVGGHAGLFSDAEDLASMMHMFMEGGYYGHQQLLNDSIIKEFTRCQYCTGERDENRRGIVFDKPNRHGDEGPTCDCVSYESFGHSGFTGTLSWADPEEDLVYVFLSNRIYPSMDNKKLIKMGIRTEIMKIIYEAIANRETSDISMPKDLGLMEP